MTEIKRARSEILEYAKSQAFDNMSKKNTMMRLWR